MPAFDALLSAEEIEQVIDYVIFLSIRGKTELDLIDEAAISDEKDPNALSAEVVKDVANGVFNKWKQVETQVLNPPIPRTPSSHESILRGRELFLGRTPEKLECAGCHGPLALGDGPSFVNQDDFNKVVFGGNPSERAARLEELPDAVKTLWKQKPDDWGNPLRPANLQRGVYKGGRRPLDLYWRIAKGINGRSDAGPLSPNQGKGDLGPGQLRLGPPLSARTADRREFHRGGAGDRLDGGPALIDRSHRTEYRRVRPL